MPVEECESGCWGIYHSTEQAVALGRQNRKLARASGGFLLAEMFSLSGPPRRVVLSNQIEG